MPVCSTCGATYSSTVRICVRDGTPLVADQADDRYLGTLLDGKYRIDAFINAGGMGSLYRALHVMLDKTVAVKVIKNELVTSDEVVARFQREARAASNLDHPNIVSVYDLGQTPDGTLYIAMEFIDGPSLKEVIRRDGPLTPRDTIDILRQVASALSSAHRKQIVHRDLKSDNLMLEMEDGRRVVKLVDFGIAKTFDDSTQLTAAGFMLGTPNYMSPEQAAGKPVDHRTDLYSLGVILYEMLTGKVPFGDTALTSLLVRLATEVPPPPSARRPDGQVPPALDAVAMRCLEKDPDHRYQSANEFADALERASAEIDGESPTRSATIPRADATLVRPALARPTASAATRGGQSVAAAPARSSVPGVPPADVPAPIARRGLGPVAIGLIVLGIVALAVVAIVVGPRLSNNAQPQAPTSASATIQQPAAAPAAASAAPAPAAQTPPPVTAAPDSNFSSNTAPVGSPPSIDDGRRRVPAASASAKSSTPSPSRAPAESTSPRPRGNVERAPSAPTPTPAPALPTPPVSTSPPPPARVAPAVSVTCEGAADVCGAVRSEVLQALRDNPVAADTGIAIRVTQVSQKLSTELGAPRTIPTFSIDLTGNSGGATLVMPPKRLVEVDPLFASRTLQQAARQLASGVVDALKAVAPQGRN